MTDTCTDSSMKPNEVEKLTVEQRMERKKIPKAIILENIDDYLETKKLNLDEASETIKEDFRKYKIMEESFSVQKAKMQESIADYKKSLAALEMLDEEKKKNKKSIELTYKLDENIYAKSVVEDFDKVCVWLGANVMVEYGREEAKEMLLKNLKNIERVYGEVDEELGFIQDQITTTEVNLAHLHNFSIQQQQQSSNKSPLTSNA